MIYKFLERNSISLIEKDYCAWSMPTAVLFLSQGFIFRGHTKYINFFQRKRMFLCQCNSTFDINDAFFFSEDGLSMTTSALSSTEKWQVRAKYFTGLNQFSKC